MNQTAITTKRQARNNVIYRIVRPKAEIKQGIRMSNKHRNLV